MILANESRNIQFNVQLHENDPQSVLKHQQPQADTSLPSFIYIFLAPHSAIKKSFVSFFVLPVITYLGLGSYDVSSIIRLRLRPEELPRKQCLTRAEQKTKSL